MFRILWLFFCAFYINPSFSQDSKPTEGPGFFGFKPGTTAPITGSASEQGGAKNAARSLEKCEKPLGTIAVVQPQNMMMLSLTRIGLPAPSNLLRLMIQQSGCFQVVERGVGFDNLMQERRLQQGGQLQSGSNVGDGQMITADFVMTPEVNITQGNSGGAAMLGGFGALLGPVGIIAGLAASNLKFQQASTTLIISDARSGIQIAAASGSAEKTDFQIGGVLGAVGLGAYGNTPEGQVVAAAMLNNYNEVVSAVRNQKSIVAPNATPAARENAAASVAAGVVFKDGDILSPKIPGIKILSAAAGNATVLSSLKREDQIVYMGIEENGFLKVQGADGEGWVDKRMIRK